MRTNVGNCLIRTRTTEIRSIIICLLTLVIIYAILYYSLNRAAYHPTLYPAGAWALQSELGAQDVWLWTADRLRIHAWWIPKTDAHFVTLFLHGNAGNVTNRVAHIEAIHEAGSALLMLDYRGYGKSEGRPTERGLYADGDAGYRYLLEAGYPANRIVLHGESLGTAVVIDIAARRSSAGVILEAPFTSARDLASRILPVLGPLFVWGFDSKDKISRIGVPILVIHGDQDDIVPIQFGRSLFEAASESKSFWSVAGAGHNDLVEVAGPELRKRLKLFYESLE